RRAPRPGGGRALAPREGRARAGALHGRRDSRIRLGAGLFRTARRSDDRRGNPARARTGDVDAARRPDDARDREAPARRGDASCGAPRSGDVSRRHDDSRDPRARAGRCAGCVPERDSGGDGTVERASRRRLVTGDVELVVLRDANEVAAAVAEQLGRAASAGGHIALTGGTTPERAYTEAAEREPDWSKTEIWWSDERCVPPDDDLSN